MPTAKPMYEAAAQEYLRSLPPEHFMEATAQSRQREITLESLALVRDRRSDVHVFNELLVQYPVSGQKKPGQVVPDNMVVLSEEPIQADTSYNLPLEPAAPFWMLEYVSKNTRRKDYDDNFDRYERDLKVPYFLLFYPEQQELTLYHYAGGKYISVKPNEHDRLAIPELELELALHQGWVRFWYQDKLLPLPGELQRDLDAAQQRAEEEKRRADGERHRADKEKQRADAEKQRADEADLRVNLEKRRADENERELAALKQAMARLQAATESPRRANDPGSPPEIRRADQK